MTKCTNQMKNEDFARINLTFKQTRVAVGLAFGLTIRDMASYTETSEATISKHIIAIKRKLGVKTRQGLLSYLMSDPKFRDVNLYYHFYPLIKKKVETTSSHPIMFLVEIEEDQV